MSTPGRHALRITLTSQDVSLADFQQDLAAVDDSHYWIAKFPWLIQRWEAARFIDPRPLSMTGQPMDLGDRETDPFRYVPEDDYPSDEAESDLDFESDSSWPDRRILEASEQRFDPRFISIECESSELSGMIVMIRGVDESPPIFREYCEATETKTSEVSEAACTKLFIIAANKLGAKLVGDDYQDLFLSKGGKGLAANAAIKFRAEHGQAAWDASTYLSKPDIIILRQGRDGSTEHDTTTEFPTDWGPVLATGEARKNRNCDMRVAGTDRQKTGLRILDNIAAMAKNHPVTGRACGLTLSGRFLRFWVSDSLSFATTLLYDLANPDHAEDIAKILAFLTGDIENISDTYSPPTDRFTLINPEDKTEQVWEWCTTDGSTEFTGLPYKMLEVRNELWGRRTAVFAGFARRLNAESDTAEPVTIKCAWLPTYLQTYEHKILTHINNALKEPVDSKSYPFLAEAKAAVDPEVLACIPKPLGMLKDCKRTSRSVKAPLGDSDGLYSNDEQEEVYLELSVLVTTGPHGERIPSATSSLSLRDHYDILSGALQTLWIVSCCNLHYRDINLGNILFHLKTVTENGQGVSKVVGYLIDYGNARILDERRKQLPQKEEDAPSKKATALHLDDARSINAYFVCLHVLEALQLSTLYRETESSLKAHEKNLQNASMEAKRLALAKVIAKEEKMMQDLLAKMAGMQHRYIDDIESLLYSFCFWMARVAGTEHQNKSTVYKIHQPRVKRDQWEEALVTLTEEILVDHVEWNEPVLTWANTTTGARDQLNVSTIAAEMSTGENTCFATCYNYLKEMRMTMPITPLKRGASKIAEPASPTKRGKSANLLTGLVGKKTIKSQDQS